MFCTWSYLAALWCPAFTVSNGYVTVQETMAASAELKCTRHIGDHWSILAAMAWLRLHGRQQGDSVTHSPI